MLTIYDYLFAKTLAENDLANSCWKNNFVDLLLPIIATIKNEIIKEHYIKKISNELETSYESVVREMEKLQQPRITPAIKEQEKQKRTKRNCRGYLWH